MEIHHVPLKDIIVEGRAREDFGEVGELAQSIRTLGLLQPIVLENNNELRAGERRFRAMQLLGWTEAPCVFLHELSEVDRLRVELEENSKRKNLTWQEEIGIVTRLHKLMKEQNPTLTNETIAERLNISPSKLQKDLSIASAMKDNPDVGKEKTAVDAFRRTQRIRENALRKLEASMLGELDLSNLVVGEENGEGEPKREKKTGGEPIREIPKLFTHQSCTIMNMDCLEGIKTLHDESVDLLITDFPFGVDLDKNADFERSWEEVYQDKPDQLLETLLPQLAEQYARVLKTGAHFYIFYPSIYEHRFRTTLGEHLTIQNVPLIWNKRFGGTTFSPYTRYAPNFEPILFGSKGPFKETRKLSEPGYCVLNYDSLAGGKKGHPAEKPLDLIIYLVSQSSVEGELVLDTFSGSGSTARACQRMGRKAIAFELSQHWYEKSILRLQGGID